MSSADSTGGARLILRPLVVFVAVAGIVFLFAELHLARPGLPRLPAGQKVVLGDFYNGQTIFSQKCAACHGRDGQGGGVGPMLAGDHITLAAAEARIVAGGPTMPARFVSGQQERDVLAYLATILATK